MKQLLKQVLKSFKSSILLLFGLVFISTIIVFSSFSSFSLFQNISYSKNLLEKKGNASDFILMKDYKQTSIEYKVSKQNSEQHLVLDEVALGYQAPTSNENKINLVFPYSDADFKNPNINSLPFSTRRASMHLVHGITINSNGIKANNIRNTDNKDWGSVAMGFGWGPEKNFNYPSEYVFELINVNGDPNNQKPVLSYAFDREQKTISSSIKVTYGYFYPTQQTFNYKDKLVNSNIEHYKVIKNLTITDNPWVKPFYISKYANQDLLSKTPLGEYLNFLTQKVDTKLNSSDPDGYKFLKYENHPTYTFEIDKEKLSNKLDIKVLEKLENEKKQLESQNKFGVSDLDKINNVKLIIKNDWVKNESNLIEEIIDKKKKELISNATKIFQSRYDEIIEEEVKKEIDEQFNTSKQKDKNNEHLTFGTQSQFNINDSNSSNKYIVSEKGHNKIDDIVYTRGTKLNNSTKYLDKYSDNSDILNEPKEKLTFDKFKKEKLFEHKTHINNGNKKYFKNYIKFLKFSRPLTNKKLNKNIQDQLDDVFNAIVDGYAINDEKYNFLFYYFLPSYDLINNQDDNIFDNHQGISLMYSEKGGFTSMSLNVLAVDYDKNAFTVTVPEIFLEQNKKEVIPREQYEYLFGLDKKNKEKTNIGYDENNEELANIDKFNEWIEKEENQKYILSINSRNYIIVSTGLSPEMIFPSHSIDSPIPNVKTESVIYLTKNGYNSVLYGSPFNHQYKYLNFDYKNYFGKNEFIKKLNDRFNKNGYLDSSLGPVVYSLDSNSVLNILTLRKLNANLVQTTILGVSIVIITVLVLLGLYLSYLLVKGYISKNQVQLAIIKANGFTSLSITLAISLFGVISAIFAGITGYIISHFFQSLFYQIVSPYWFAKVYFMTFNPFLMIIGTLLLLFAFSLFTFIIIRITFKKPINQLIAENVEIKASKLLNVMKQPTNFVNPLFKFRVALSVTNIWRTIFFVILYAFSLSTITASITIGNKFEISQYQTSLNRDYAYKFTFDTPTEQSGLYKIQKYSELGFSDLDQGLVPLYKTEKDNGFEYKGNAYTIGNSFNYPYNIEDLVIRDLDGNPKIYENDGGTKKYLGNMLIPSYSAFVHLQEDPNFYSSTVFTKWFMDFDIPLININPWKLVRGLFPPQVVSRAETQDQKFMHAIYNHEKLKDEAKKYIIYDSGTNVYKINKLTVLQMDYNDLKKIGFRKEFLHFICKIYGDEELSNLDVKLSFGIIPYDEKNTETFTEVHGNLEQVFKNGSTKMKSNSETIMGIKKNSKFITLTNDDLKPIQDKLFTEPEKDENGNLIYPIIITNGIAYKHSLKTNDIIRITPNKDYLTYSRKQLENYKKYNNDLSQNNHKDGIKDDNNVSTPKTLTFKIVDISSDSFGGNIYINQEIANKLNSMEMNFKNPYEGAMYQTNSLITGTPLTRENTNNTKYIIHNEKGIGGFLPLESSVSDKKDLLIPFNGIMFDNSKTPLFLDNAIAFQSKIGVWNLYDYSNKEQLIPKLNKNSIDKYFNKAIAIKNTKFLKEMGFSTSQEYIDSFINKKYNNKESYAFFLTDIFGDKPVNIAISDLYADEIVGQLYGNFIGTVQTLKTTTLAIITPLIVVMVLVLSAAMLSEFERIIIVLKTIGYSDSKNIISILSIFIPIVIVSALLSMLMLFGLFSFIQYIIFSLSSIYLTSSINFIHYLYGLLGLLGVLVINFGFMIYKYKTQKLKTAIVD